MDLLGGCGSSSDEEDQPPLMVYPSKEEGWTEKFQKLKAFYEEHGHLALPRNDPESLRLAEWLTYQRHQYKALRKDQLERLESINYNTMETLLSGKSNTID